MLVVCINSLSQSDRLIVDHIDSIYPPTFRTSTPRPLQASSCTIIISTLSHWRRSVVYKRMGQVSFTTRSRADFLPGGIAFPYLPRTKWTPSAI